MFRKFTVLFLAFCLAAGAVGCGDASSGSSSSPSSSSLSESSSSSPAQVSDEDLTSLMDEIYTHYEDVMGVVDVESDAVHDILGLTEDMYEQLAARQSLARFNIGDVVIVRPAQGQTDAVKDALEAYRKSKEDLFQNYNVGGDYEKAQNAEIYERGGYVILVMFADNQPAKDAISAVIPE